MTHLVRRPMHLVDSVFTNTGEAEFFERGQNVLNMLAKDPRDSAKYHGGRLALELAWKSDNEVDQLRWLGEAHDSWQKATLNVQRNGIISPESISAAINEATLPSYASLILLDQMPALKTRRKMYERLCKLGEMIVRVNYDWIEADREAERLPGKSGGSPHIENRRALSGAAGELAVILLQERFVQKKLKGDEITIGLPSLFSQDRGINGQSANREYSEAWDMTVFEKLDRNDPLEAVHLVQVKTRRGLKESEEKSAKKRLAYAPGIAVAYIEDFVPKNSLTKGRGTANKLPGWVTPFKILSEIYREFNRGFNDDTNSKLTRTLDLRTEKMHDCIYRS